MVELKIDDIMKQLEEILEQMTKKLKSDIMRQSTKWLRSKHVHLGVEKILPS